jgi:hypothetical protein
MESWDLIKLIEFLFCIEEPILFIKLMFLGKHLSQNFVYEVLKLYWLWVIIFVTDLQFYKNLKVTILK